MMRASSNPRNSEWASGWLLLLSACAGGVIPSLHFYSMGLFFDPLEKAFGWSRSEASFGLIISSTVGILVSPIVGAVIDRIGSRRVAIPGIILYITAFGALSLISSSIWEYWGLFLLLALGQACLTQVVWVSAVAGRFVRSRGLALGIVQCGASIGSLIVPICAELLIGEFGWRTAYLGLALGFGGLSLTLIVPFFKVPRHSKLAEGDTPSPSARSQVGGLSWREGLRSPTFWCLASAGFFVTFSIMSLLVHFVPMLTEKGFDRTVAAALAGLIGIASICGRVGEGYLLDRFPASIVASLSLCLPIVACAIIYLFDGSLYLAAIIALILGLSLGSETNIIAYLSAKHFGLTSYGVLFGTIVGLINLGAGSGPYFASRIYDGTGGYDYVLLVVAIICMAFSVLIFRLGRAPTALPAIP